MISTARGGSKVPAFNGFTKVDDETIAAQIGGAAAEGTRGARGPIEALRDE